MLLLRPFSDVCVYESVVKLTEQQRRELVCGKVGDYGFVHALFDRKSDHT